MLHLATYMHFRATLTQFFKCRGGKCFQNVCKAKRYVCCVVAILSKSPAVLEITEQLTSTTVEPFKIS